MKITVVTCLAALAGGCAKTDSSDLLTTGIYAAISAQANGDGATHVYATLYVGTPDRLNFVDLTGDDQLIAQHGAQEMVMSETTLLNIVSHHAQFNGPDNEGDQFQVAFERSVDNGAPNSIATLPGKFAFTTPPTTASRAQPVTLSWSPIDSATPMRWDAQGDCINNVGTNIIVDSGSLTIPANAFVKRTGQMIADNCVVTVSITRAQLGQLDPGYGKGGLVEGQQIRKVMLMSTP